MSDQYSDVEDISLLEDTDHFYPSVEALVDKVDGWHKDALCSELISTEELPPNAFISDSDENDSTLDAICSRCPVRQECLIDAVQDDTSQGFRAGYRFDGGAVYREDAREINSLLGIPVKVRNRRRNASNSEV